MDSFEGVTHALRTSEYRDREPQYVQVQAMMGLRKVHPKPLHLNPKP